MTTTRKELPLGDITQQMATFRVSQNYHLSRKPLRTQNRAPRGENQENIDPVKKHVRNIDAEDADKFQFCSTYVNDVFWYAFKTEGNSIVPSNYLDDHVVTPRFRAILINRLVEVHDKFRLSPEVIYLTVNFVDRYLYATPEATKKQLHAIGVTAMLLACKVEEVSVPAVGDFVYITDHEASKDEIMALEVDILKKLKCDVMPMHALFFLRRFSKAGDVAPKKHCIAKYIIELSFVEIAFTQVLPSKVAACALYLTLRLAAVSSYANCWDSTLEHYSTYSEADLVDTAVEMLELVKNAGRSSCMAVHNKYKQSKCNKTALYPEVSRENAQKLALRMK